MSARTRVLIIEDNPITRKLFRLVLSQEGFDVSEAEDGATAIKLVGHEAFDLILQDLLLPDMDGLVLVRRLRDLPNGADTPIIACTGFLSRIELGQVTASGFNDLLAKPVDPVRLVNAVRAHLPQVGGLGLRSGKGRRVLVVDDDPVQLKLTRILLMEHGFVVSTAVHGVEALAEARRAPPDAILSDVMMPRLDGFQLSTEVRRDPLLSAVPVVLISSSYVDPEDRRLADQSGASALLVRTPDPREVIGLLIQATEGRLRAPAPAAETDRLATHHERVTHQLERQVETLALAEQRSSIHAAMLSVVAGISEALARRFHLDDSTENVLASVLDACGASKGALYLVADEGPLELRAHAGFGNPDAPRTGTFWGYPGLLSRVLGAALPLALPSPTTSVPEETAFLASLPAESALLVPLVSTGGSFGLLLLASASRDLAKPDWLSFARTIAVQLGQALVLARSVSRLATSEERFRQITEAIHEVFWMIDARTRKSLYVSPACKEVWGRTQEDMMSSPASWTETIVPEDRDRVLQHMQSTPVTEILQLEFRVARPDGTVRWIKSRGFPIRDATGEVYRIAGIAEDVTELKIYEQALRTSETQLRQSQKMETIGRLAGGVAHDFNNMLTPILGYAQLVRAKLGADCAFARELGEIEKAAHRAAGLTRQLLAFSRKQVLQPRVVDPNAVVSGILHMLCRVVGEDIRLSAELAAMQVRIVADPGQIEQVLLNLVVNARDAVSPGGRIVIRTEVVDSDGFVTWGSEVAPAGRYVRLSVEDSGCGMAPEVLSHLFEPFFTTKEEGKGTGLGLSTVYGIVKQSGGHLQVRSESGQGTRFDIYFPAATEAETSSESKETAPPPRARGGEVVLLVEDEVSVRNVSRAMIEAAGWTVVEAEDGEAALAIAANGARIDVVVTDTVMPRMGGFDLADRLKERGKAIPVVFVTGYTDRHDQMEARRRSGAPYLQKPYTTEDLAKAVRQAIDGNAAR